MRTTPRHTGPEHTLHALDGAAPVRAFEQLHRFGWTVLHDVAWPERRYATIDHLAIGPAGVFVVVSTTETAVLTRSAATAGADADDLPQVAEIEQVLAAVTALRQVLPEWVADRLQPVVSVVSSAPHESQAQGVQILSTTSLPDVLASWPAVWADWQASVAVDDVRAAARRDARGPRPLPSRATRRDRHRARLGVAAGATALVGASVAAAAQSTLVVETAQLISSLLR